MATPLQDSSLRARRSGQRLAAVPRSGFAGLDARGIRRKERCAGSPVALFCAQCLGHSNVASSEVYLDQQLPAEVVVTGMAIGRSNDDDGHINAQSYLVYMYNRNGKSQLTFAHSGGPYYTKTEVFGTGIIY